MPKNTAAVASNVAPLRAPVIWSDPDTSLLDDEATRRPEFPSQLLGTFWAKWVQDVAASKNAPADYVGASLITLAASLIGNARTAQAGTHVEPSILWTVLVGDPSSGKSPAMDPFSDAISDIEMRMVASSASGAVQAATAIRLDDTTAQSAAQLSAHSSKGLILVRDELSGWWDRMRKADEEAFWIKAYGARLERRSSGGKPPIQIDRLSISVLGAAQPDTLQGLLSSRENKGFASRLLYVCPARVKGYRVRRATAAIPCQDALIALWDLPLMDGRPKAIPVTRQALPTFASWASQRLEQAETEGHGIWGQWLGKQSGTALRLALVMEHLWWAAERFTSKTSLPPPTQITRSAMSAAMKFIDSYSAPMAEIALGEATRPTTEQDALQLIRVLRKTGENRFNARMLGRVKRDWQRVLTPKAMGAACDLLEDAALIRHVGERADGKAGKRPKDYEVNPILFDTNAAKPPREGAR